MSDEMPESDRIVEPVAVIVPDVEPESDANLALHVGRLHESHEEMRREWAMHKVEWEQLKALHQTLIDELQVVEEVAEEIASEPDAAGVDESATVAEPMAVEPERKAHWIVRGLRGH